MLGKEWTVDDGFAVIVVWKREMMSKMNGVKEKR
jgi:hypothetical protein